MSASDQAIGAGFVHVVNSIARDAYFGNSSLEWDARPVAALAELVRDTLGDGTAARALREAASVLSRAPTGVTSDDERTLAAAEKLIQVGAREVSLITGAPNPLQIGAAAVEEVLRHCIRLERRQPGWIPYWKLPLMRPEGLPPDAGYLASEFLHHVARRQGLNERDEISLERDLQLRMKLLTTALRDLKAHGLGTSD